MATVIENDRPIKYKSIYNTTDKLSTPSMPNTTGSSSGKVPSIAMTTQTPNPENSGNAAVHVHTHQLFLHIGGTIHTLNFETATEQVESTLSFMNDLGIPSHLFRLKFSGKVLKAGAQLHFPLPTENIYAIVLGKGGCPLDQECSKCHIHLDSNTSKFHRISEMPEIDCRSWEINQLKYSPTAVLCVDCFDAVQSRCNAEKGGFPYRTSKEEDKDD
jgi:hypothetical protein